VTTAYWPRVAGAQLDAANFRLNWPVQAGKTYNILGSAVVTGSYQPVQTFTADSDGVMSQTLPISGGAKFFLSSRKCHNGSF